MDELYPFADEETGKQMFRRTTKILSHGKYKLATDGQKNYQPMHKQLLDYMRNAKEDNEDHEKTLVQEYLRNRIRNTLPEEFRRENVELRLPL